VKAFDKVKRDKLFEMLQSKNIPNLLLKIIIEIYCGNKIIKICPPNKTQLPKENVFVKIKDDPISSKKKKRERERETSADKNTSLLS